MREIKTFVGANGRTLQFAAKTSAAAAYNLTDLTVTLTAVKDSDVKIDNVAVTVTDATAGEFEYTPTVAEIDVKGTYLALVKLTTGVGKVDYLEKFQIVVEEVLGS